MFLLRQARHRSTPASWQADQPEVEVSEPCRTLVWSWAREADTPFEQAFTTRVEWKLTAADGGGTVLELRESGFETAKDRDGNDGGWDAELGELAELLETEAR